MDYRDLIVRDPRVAIASAAASADDPDAAELRREIDIGVKQAEAGQLRSGADFFDELRERVRRG